MCQGVIFQVNQEVPAFANKGEWIPRWISRHTPHSTVIAFNRYWNLMTGLGKPQRPALICSVRSHHDKLMGMVLNNGHETSAMEPTTPALSAKLKASAWMTINFPSPSNQGQLLVWSDFIGRGGVEAYYFTWLLGESALTKSFPWWWGWHLRATQKLWYPKILFWKKTCYYL